MDREALVALLNKEVASGGSMNGGKVPVLLADTLTERCAMHLRPLFSVPNRRNPPIQLQSCALPPAF